MKTINLQTKKIIFAIASMFGFMAFGESPECRINDNNVRFRTNPTLDKSAVLGKFNSGDVIIPLERTERKETIDGSSDYWYRFSLGEDKYDFIWGGKSAWVYGKYLDCPVAESLYCSTVKDALKKDYAEQLLRSIPEEYIEKCKDVEKAKATTVKKIYEYADIGSNNIFYNFDFNDYKLTTVKNSGSNSKFVGVKFSGNLKSAPAVHLGMTRDEVISIFGDDFREVKTGSIYYIGFGGYDYDAFISLHFEFENNRLSATGVYIDGFIARYDSIIESGCTEIFDNF